MNECVNWLQIEWISLTTDCSTEKMSHIYKSFVIDLYSVNTIMSDYDQVNELFNPSTVHSTLSFSLITTFNQSQSLQQI